MLVVLLLLLPLLRTASMMDKMWSEKSHSHMRRHVEFIDFVFCKSQFRISHIIYRNALSTGEELERGRNKVGGWLGQCSVWTLGNGRNSIYSRMDTPRGKLKMGGRRSSTGHTLTHYIEMMNLYNSAGQCISSLSQHPLNK